MARSRSNGCTAPNLPVGAHRSRRRRVGPHRLEHAGQRGEEVTVGGEQLGAPPHLEQTAGERVLRAQRTVVECPLQAFTMVRPLPGEPLYLIQRPSSKTGTVWQWLH